MTAIPADASGCRTNSLSSSVVSDPKGAIVVYRAVCVEMRPPGSFSFVVRFTTTFLLSNFGVCHRSNNSNDNGARNVIIYVRVSFN